MQTSARFLENLCRSRGEGPEQVQHTLYEGELMTSTAVAECYSLSIGSIVCITDQWVGVPYYICFAHVWTKLGQMRAEHQDIWK